MKRNTIFRWVAFGVAVLIGFLVLEIRETSTLNYDIQYNYYSDEPYGLSVFHKALDLRFGEDNVIFINYIDSLPETDADNAVFVYIAEDISLDLEQNSFVSKFHESGGKYLFAAENFDFMGDNYLFSHSAELSRTHTYDLNWADTFHRFSDIYSDADSLRYGHVPQEFSFSDYELEELYEVDALVRVDSLDAVKMYDSTFVFHGFPVLFTNIGTSQSYYPEHFNKIFDLLNAEKVYILQQGIVGADTSLLKVVMADRGLRFAFYILILGCLLLFLFNIKRIQAPIPLIVPYKNRTMDYLQTLSFLYQKANKPMKLAFQMKTNFYQYISKEFNLKEKQRDFTQSLSQKTKVESHFIDSIVKDLALFTESASFEPQRLIVTHNKIKTFKDRIHGNRGTGRK